MSRGLTRRLAARSLTGRLLPTAQHRLRALARHRELLGAHAPDPPETGGRTATSSPSSTGAARSAGSPFSQTLLSARTAAKWSP